MPSRVLLGVLHPIKSQHLGKKRDETIVIFLWTHFLSFHVQATDFIKRNIILSSGFVGGFFLGLASWSCCRHDSLLLTVNFITTSTILLSTTFHLYPLCLLILHWMKCVSGSVHYFEHLSMCCCDSDINCVTSQFRSIYTCIGVGSRAPWSVHVFTDSVEKWGIWSVLWKIFGTLHGSFFQTFAKSRFFRVFTCWSPSGSKSASARIAQNVKPISFQSCKYTRVNT